MAANNPPVNLRDAFFLVMVSGQIESAEVGYCSYARGVDLLRTHDVHTVSRLRSLVLYLFVFSRTRLDNCIGKYLVIVVLY